jgi:hypothetical protein
MRVSIRHLKDFSKSNTTLVSIFLVTVSLAVVAKVIMISYGLPFQIHVDEATVLKNPFKLLLNYASGNFSQSTTLLNWITLAFFGFIFLVGLLTGRWHSIGEFQSFLITDSPDLILWARILSGIISLAASLILIRLVLKITSDLWLRTLFIVMVLFNPIELNSVNWMKYEAISYFMTAILIYYAHSYFFLENKRHKAVLYILLFVGLSVRIELIAMLIGVLIFDFAQNLNQIKSFLFSIFKPSAIGIFIYLIVTLYPVKILYNYLAEAPKETLTTSKTFESAIFADLNWDSILFGISNSDYYLYASFALLGPVVMIAFFISIFRKRQRFIILPFVILAFFLIIYPVKNTHYLMNASIFLLIGSFLTIESWGIKRMKYSFGAISAAWVFSFCVSQIILASGTGDLRIKAREYVLASSNADDTIYVEGIFSQIQDKPKRYRLKSEAAKLIGSTGLSNEYFANTLNDFDTRAIITVSEYDPFAETPFNKMFNNNYDTALLLLHRPKYYIRVTPAIIKHPNRKADFCDFIETKFEKIISFHYDFRDPRLFYSNIYYFHHVDIFKIKPLAGPHTVLSN